MKVTKEVRVVGFIIWITLSALCFLVNRNTTAVSTGNEQSARQQYERVLLGCNTQGSIDSTDQNLRELCDVKLPKMKKALDK